MKNFEDARKDEIKKLAKKYDVNSIAYADRGTHLKSAIVNSLFAYSIYAGLAPIASIVALSLVARQVVSIGSIALESSVDILKSLTDAIIPKNNAELPEIRKPISELISNHFGSKHLGYFSTLTRSTVEIGSAYAAYTYLPQGIEMLANSQAVTKLSAHVPVQSTALVIGAIAAIFAAKALYEAYSIAKPSSFKDEKVDFEYTSEANQNVQMKGEIIKAPEIEEEVKEKYSYKDSFNSHKSYNSSKAFSNPLLDVPGAVISSVKNCFPAKSAEQQI